MSLDNGRAEILATLPSPLKNSTTAAEWYNIRRPAILQYLEQKFMEKFLPPGTGQFQDYPREIRRI